MVIWKAPKLSADAQHIKTLDRLHQILQVIHEPQSLTHLRDSFRLMSDYHKERHDLYDKDEGFHDVFRAILVRGSEKGFTLKANRFYDQ